MMDIKSNLLKLMAEKNVITRDIAKATGLNKSTINSILSGSSSNPSASNILAISKALEVSMEYLLLGEEVHIDYLSKEQMKIFDNVTKSTINIIIKKNLCFTSDKLNNLIKEIYQYSIQLNPPVVDDKFIHWIIDNYKS